MQETVDWINGWVWSPALVYLCLLVGLYFSIRTRFMQVRHMGEMVRAMFRQEFGRGGVVVPGAGHRAVGPGRHR